MTDGIHAYRVTLDDDPSVTLLFVVQTGRHWHRLTDEDARQLYRELGNVLVWHDAALRARDTLTAADVRGASWWRRVLGWLR